MSIISNFVTIRPSLKTLVARAKVYKTIKDFLAEKEEHIGPSTLLEDLHS